MLAHQLRMLPPFEAFWDELPAFFGWLASRPAPRAPAPYLGVPGEAVIRTRVLPVRAAVPLQVRGTMQAHLDGIRFAASNRLCIDLLYQDSTRRIEPYSLRRTLEGNVILHAHNLDKDTHRSYRLDRIQGARITDETFTPRFAIELTPSGPVSVLQSANRGSTHLPPTRATARATGTRAPNVPRRAPGTGPRGPTYVYRCSYCGKQFPRKKRTDRLNPHKNKNGRPCPGRNAHFVRIRR